MISAPFASGQDNELPAEALLGEAKAINCVKIRGIYHRAVFSVAMLMEKRWACLDSDQGLWFRRAVGGRTYVRELAVKPCFQAF